jgi:hypothetical protein
MKKVFFLIAILSIFGSNLKAQVSFQDAAQEAATIICNCVNKTYKSMDDILNDESGEKGKQFEACMESNNQMMDKKYGHLETEPGYSSEMIFELMLEKLAKLEKCELANMMLQLGRSENETESDESESESDDE